MNKTHRDAALTDDGGFPDVLKFIYLEIWIFEYVELIDTLRETCSVV